MYLHIQPIPYAIIGLVWYRYLNDPIIFLYKVESTSFIKVSLTHVSTGVETDLHFCILNLFNMSYVYFLWLITTHCAFISNSFPRKYVRFPKSDISNGFTILLLKQFISASLFQVTINLCLLVVFLHYMSCSFTHFTRPCWRRNLSIFLLQALGTCFKLYISFFSLYA